MALSVQAQLLDGLLVHDEALFALKEAVVDGMRADPLAMLAIAHAELVQVPLEVHIIVIFNDLYGRLICGSLHLRSHPRSLAGAGHTGGILSANILCSSLAQG